MILLKNIDCIEAMREMREGSVDYVLTSPPYNRRTNDKYNYYDDNKVDYFSFLCSSLDEMLRVSRKNVFLNIQKTSYNKSDVFHLLSKYSEEIYDVIIWEKSNPTPTNRGVLTNAYEFIIVFGSSLEVKNPAIRNVITTSAYFNPYFKLHRALMHPRVADYIINNFTEEGDVILDPFAGLCTTALSCIDSKRDFIGFEISSEYVDLALKRLEEHKRQLRLF